MSYQFFSNTGIQFFGDSDLIPEMELNKDPVSDGIYGKTNTVFAVQILRGEWLPFSLDGDRSLLRILYKKPNVIFSIDTTIRGLGDNANQDYRFSLVNGDIAETLSIHPDYFQNDEYENLYTKINTNSEIVSWMQSIFERKLSNPSLKRFLDNNPEYRQFSPELTYKVFIAELIRCTEGKLLPEISILSDHAAAAVTIDTNLYIDLGNSRTIGLVVEKDIDTKNYNIHNAAPLKILNYTDLENRGAKYLNDYATKNESEYDYLISSNIKFKKNIFAKYPKSISFNLPNITCIGLEADTLKETRLQTPNTGISGPKRYLWSNNQEVQFWNFHHSSTDSSLIKGEILKYLPFNDDDNVLNDIYEVGLTAAPITPSYPKRVMMIFAMVELIYQAFTQINSWHYRVRVGNTKIKRTLKNIVISFPTAMPQWERDRLLKQSKKAILILKKLKSIPYDINILLGSDEATCSQVSFLYGEAARFPGQGELFFNLISGKRRPSKIRVASLDIGGGTTDLMIADYERTNPTVEQNSDLKQTIKYSDGINYAGDDILKHLITTFVIERLRDAISSPKFDDRFPEYFGDAAPEADKQMRVEAMNSLFIPIAEFYMYYMDKNNTISKNEIEVLDTLNNLNDFLKRKNLKQINITEYFRTHDILPETIDLLPIPHLIPTIEELEREVIRVYQDKLHRFSWVISQHRPDFLILAGKTTSLPIIAKTFRKYITLPPGKIIALKDYFIGAWHPFSSKGYVDDPKTSVVVGNAISHISINREMNDVNILTEGPESDYTLNFIGANATGNLFNRSQVIYNSSEPINGSIFLQNRINILYRNIDDPRMPSNLMYVIYLDRDNNIMPGNIPIEIQLNTENPKKRLTIENVEGEVIDTDTNSARPATIDDIILREQTLMDGEYYLDNGKFGVVDK